MFSSLSRPYNSIDHAHRGINVFTYVFLSIEDLFQDKLDQAYCTFIRGLNICWEFVQGEKF